MAENLIENTGALPRRDVVVQVDTRALAWKAAFLALALIAPICLAVYSAVALKNPFTRWQIADIAAFTALYLVLILLLPRKRAIRVPATLLIALWFVIFHGGNLIFARFYNTWVHVDIFEQWGDAGALGSAVARLVRPADVLFVVVLPLATAVGAAWTPASLRRRVWIPALLAVASVLLIAHFQNVGTNVRPKHNEPMLYFVRQPIYEQIVRYREKGRRRDVWKDMQAYYPTDGTKYKRRASSKGLLTQRVLGAEQGPTEPYNVVLILGESLIAKPSGAYGHSPSFTPNLDRLARDSLVFKNYYANGSQTVRGEMALLCSYYPNLRGGPIYVKKHKTSMRCLPDILHDFDYDTYWIGSYKKTYSKKGRFLKRHHVRHIYDREDIPAGYKKIGWGPSDEDLFASAADRLSKAEQPFFAEIMTLSNHYPFNFDYPSNDTVPTVEGGEEYNDYLRGIHYTDFAIGKFFDAVKDEPWFERTIFIISGDHGVWRFPETGDVTDVEKIERYFRVVGMVYAPGIIAPGVVEDVISQVDVAPTLLDIMGIRTAQAFVGRSLYTADESGPPRFALMVHDREWNIRRGEDYCYDVGEECFHDHTPWCPKGYVKDELNTMSCFKFQGDLLADREQWPGEPEIETNKDLVSLAEHLNSFNQYTLRKNRVYRTPREKKSAVADAR
ncbi:MAG: LTA synthase family protein [Deltaproteobacteria bacterium]|nr:LTA synthase family protein [Deltaproteobacteria bacterium]MCB9490070.1 LTA synthase family protein [Deltaproteobacteria bacterium]